MNKLRTRGSANRGILPSWSYSPLPALDQSQGGLRCVASHFPGYNTPIRSAARVQVGG